MTLAHLSVCFSGDVLAASCGIVRLVSTWTKLLYWQTARRELDRMNPLILELLRVFAVLFADILLMELLM